MTTFVLLHGAYQGGWIWGPVRQRLEAQGHRVYAPSLDGCGDRAHAMRSGINTESHGAEIAKLIENHAAVMVETFAQGRVQMREVVVRHDSAAAPGSR